MEQPKVTKTKPLLIAGRLDAEQASWWQVKKQSGPFTDSELLRKVVSEYMLLERNPVQFLLQRSQKPKVAGL